MQLSFRNVENLLSCTPTFKCIIWIPKLRAICRFAEGALSLFLQVIDKGIKSG